MRKGFTLIELLAVIVILAIIALIATPIVLNIIDNAKESSSIETGKMFLKGLENAITQKNLTDPLDPTNCILSDGVAKCDGINVDLELDGKAPTVANIDYSNGKVVSGCMTIDNRNYQYENGALVKTEEVCDVLMCDYGKYASPVECIALEDFKVTKYSNRVSVTGMNNSRPIKELKIPYEIDGIAVTQISGFLSKSLEKVIIPDSVTSIGNYAFSDNQLTSVTIPNSVTSIGQKAFRYNQLTSVIIPDSVTVISDNAFQKNQLTSVIIPDSVTSIGSYAFSDNQLTSVVIPDSVTVISDYAFQKNQLTSVIIPDSVTTIGKDAFQNNQLTSVVIPDSVTVISDYAFQTNQLTSVVIPNSVTSIGSFAFRYNQLTNVSVPSGATVANTAFDSGVTITRY